MQTISLIQIQFNLFKKKLNQFINEKYIDVHSSGKNVSIDNLTEDEYYFLKNLVNAFIKDKLTVNKDTFLDDFDNITLKEAKELANKLWFRGFCDDDSLGGA